MFEVIAIALFQITALLGVNQPAQSEAANSTTQPTTSSIGGSDWNKDIIARTAPTTTSSSR